MPKAKIFTNGGSQAVRLPAEFRFDSEEIEAVEQKVRASAGDRADVGGLVPWRDHRR